MKKILVPTDFSREATNALDLARQLAKKINADILLLHIIEIPYGSFSVMGEMRLDYSFEQFYQRQLINTTNEKLDEVKKDLQKEGITTEAKMIFGNPFVHIRKTITDQKVDMIIMGSKGASGLNEIIIGSNTERVIRHATCPVVTVKDPIDLSSLKSMVLASDLTPEQDEVVKEIQKLQKLLGINVHVIRVKTPYNFLSEEVAQKQLRDFAERVNLENYTLNTIEAEFADEGILDFAEQNNIGFIAMATHGRTGLAHFFGGSTAEDVANHSHIPIWTLKQAG